MHAGTEHVDGAPDVDPEAEGERRLDRLEALVLYDPRLAGPQPESEGISKHDITVPISLKDVIEFLWDFNNNRVHAFSHVKSIFVKNTDLYPYPVEFLLCENWRRVGCFYWYTLLRPRWLPGARRPR